MDAKNDPLITQILNDPKFRIQPNGVLEKCWFYRDTPLKKGQKKPLWKAVGFVSEAGPKVVHYKGHYLQVKRISWAKFRGGLRSSKSVTVLDGNESNCHPENLALEGNSESKYRAYQAGMKARNAKLTWNEAQELKAEWKDGKQKYTQAKLGEKYGISQFAVSQIINGKTYKNKKNHEVDG